MAPRLDLTIPAAQPGVASTPLALTDVVFSAAVGPASLTNVVVGGVLTKGAVRDTLAAMSGRLAEPLEPDLVESILPNLYDTRVDQRCDAVSVDLTAQGVRITP